MSTLRAVLLYLAITAAVVLTTPAFWAIVGMKVGASPVVYQSADGSLQPATIGPTSFWPDWATPPDGSPLKVVSWFGPSATAKATGMGDFTISNEPRAAAGAYAERLRAAGWEVETGRYEGAMPVIPPRTLVLCQMRATRGVHALQVSIELAPEPGKGRVFWIDTPAAGSWGLPLGTKPGAC